jgi:hypothetical protein
MSTVERFLVGALSLIAIYLLFNSQQAAGVISSIAGGASQIFATLQGRGGAA